MKKNLPEGWREVELEEIGEIVTGNTPPKIDPKNYGHNIVWIKPPDLDKEKYVANSSEKISTYAKEKVRLLPKGAVLVSCIGQIGKVAISNCDLCTNQQINSIIPKKDIIDSEFLYYTIKKIRLFLEKQGSSAVVPLLNKSEFSKIKISLPPLPIQQKIVSILEKAEQAKEMRREADELTKEFLKSVFVEMFGDKNKIKEIELFQVAEIVMGQSPPGDSYNENGKGMPFFQGKAEFTERHPIVKKWTTQPTKIARPNSVLMSVRAPVGSVNICNLDCCIGRGLASIYPKKELKLEFLFSILQVLEEKIANMGTGSTFKAINSDQLRTIKIPLPPIELQQKFASIVKEVESMKEQQKHSKEHLENLFNVLMQKAFSGGLI